MIKSKRKLIPPMQRTYCEEEEKRYQSKSPIGVSKITYWFLFVLASLICYCNCIEAAKPVMDRYEWNGAGDTWSCDNCGCSNNSFEMSCWNCGKWR